MGFKTAKFVYIFPTKHTNTENILQPNASLFRSPRDAVTRGSIAVLLNDHALPGTLEAASVEGGLLLVLLPLGKCRRGPVSARERACPHTLERECAVGGRLVLPRRDTVARASANSRLAA